MADEFTPEYWLRRAKSNFLLATSYKDNPPEEVFLEDLCFELQQCAEKSIKAVLVYSEIEIPRSHNIGELLNLILDNTSIEIPQEVKKATQLTVYAVKTRYPNWNVISAKEYEKAREVAENTYSWAKEIIEKKGSL